MKSPFPEPDHLVFGMRPVSGFSLSPDSMNVAFAQSATGKSQIFISKIDSYDPIEFAARRGSNNSPCWSPRDSNISFIHTDLDDEANLYSMELSGGDIRKLTDFENSDFGVIEWSPDGQYLAFTSTHEGALDLYVTKFRWDRIASNHLRSREGILPEIETGKTGIIGPEAGLCHSLEIARDGRRIVFIHEGPGNPASLCFQDIDGKPQQLTDPLPSGLVREDFAFPEEVSYTSSDGLEIPALLYRPKRVNSDELPPAVIRLHGGTNYQTYNCWQPGIQLLVNRGCLFLAPQFRGSTGYGKEFEQLGRGDWGGGDLLTVHGRYEIQFPAV